MGKQVDVCQVEIILQTHPLCDARDAQVPDLGLEHQDVRFAFDRVIILTGKSWAR